MDTYENILQKKIARKINQLECLESDISYLQSELSKTRKHKKDKKKEFVKQNITLLSDIIGEVGHMDYEDIVKYVHFCKSENINLFFVNKCLVS